MYSNYITKQSLKASIYKTKTTLLRMAYYMVRGAGLEPASLVGTTF